MTPGALPGFGPLSRGGAALPFWGNGFRTGKANRLRVFPGEAGSGLVRIGKTETLVWGPGASEPETRHRCTEVAGIGPLEHLSAAAAILGVRGWVLEAQHEDLPLFDGSAEPWVKWMGTMPKGPLRSCTLDLPACSWDGEHRGRLEIQVAEEFHLDVEWTSGACGPERWEGGLADLPGILGARTFVEAGEWWEAWRAGHLRCVDSESGRMLAGRTSLPETAMETLRSRGIEPRGQVWTGGAERVSMECAAHKALDLVGDIACAIGYLPTLRIVARDTGHALHARLGQALRNVHREKKETSHATPVRSADPHHT